MIKEENCNELSNFSIDHILNRAGQNTCRTITRRFHNNFEVDDIRYYTDIRGQLYGGVNRLRNRQEFEGLHQSTVMQKRDNISYQQYSFQWLNCTRFDPPRIQRVTKKIIVKRQPGRHPRIPFTPVQIELLESSYKNCPYLNSDEVDRLSRVLDLADTRIKIWFQNRRAREKREKVGKSEGIIQEENDTQ